MNECCTTVVAPLAVCLLRSPSSRTCVEARHRADPIAQNRRFFERNGSRSAGDHRRFLGFSTNLLSIPDESTTVFRNSAPKSGRDWSPSWIPQLFLRDNVLAGFNKTFRRPSPRRWIPGRGLRRYRKRPQIRRRLRQTKRRRLRQNK